MDTQSLNRDRRPSLLSVPSNPGLSEPFYPLELLFLKGLCTNLHPPS